jgi:hypoxanthine phosphoribosyltransferase
MSKPEAVYREPPVYLSESLIKSRVQDLADRIRHDYQGKEITVVCTLKGSIVFFSDLIRLLKIPVNCEFLRVSSYGSQTVSTGEVRVTLDLNEPLHGKHVLLVEDIVDTGLTLDFLTAKLMAKKPASLKTATLLLKPEALRTTGLRLDYIGFEIPNKFVVGYGLDYAEKFRGLPYIGILEE